MREDQPPNDLMIQLRDSLHHRISPWFVMVSWIYIMVMLLLVNITIIFAATSYISADKGGTICLSEEVCLRILPRAMDQDTEIGASVVEQKHRKEEWVYFHLEPDGLNFRDKKPARLCASWESVGDTAELTLYGQDGEVIEPRTKGCGVEWYIDHFSLYYFRRR